jgi:hypothetical protein
LTKVDRTIRAFPTVRDAVNDIANSSPAPQ